MTLLRSTVLAAPLTLALAAPGLADGHVTLDTEQQQFSYAFGMLVGGQYQLEFGGNPFDTDALSAGMLAGLGEGEAAMTQDEAMTAFRAYLEVLEAERMEAKLAENEAFLAENGQQEGITTTESGLQYKVLAEGAGDSPSVTDTVVVHYVGRLLDGTEFDSSIARGEPAQFPVSGVIRGWTEALQLMQPGGKLEVWIPSHLAYGPSGAGGSIGPNEILNFEMELIEVISN